MTAVTTDIDLIARYAGTLRHTLRIRILIRMTELQKGEHLSPTLLAAEFEEPLGVVSYHVRTLHDNGLIRLARKVPRRGAVEHYYALTEDGRRTASAMARLSSS